MVQLHGASGLNHMSAGYAEAQLDALSFFHWAHSWGLTAIISLTVTSEFQDK